MRNPTVPFTAYPEPALTRRAFTASLASLFACGRSRAGTASGPEPVVAFPEEADPAAVVAVTHTVDEWKAKLDGEAFKVLREQGTEWAFSGRYWDNKAKGTYVCRGCGLALFDSVDKFDSGTGWPSFTRPLKPDRVRDLRDSTHGMVRVENRCARCDGHLGHVFDDGPPPTLLRYCINSASLSFVPA